MINPTVSSNGKRKLLQRKEKNTTTRHLFFISSLEIYYYIGVRPRDSLQKLYGIKASVLDSGLSNPDRPLSLIISGHLPEASIRTKKPASPHPKTLRRSLNKSRNHKNFFSANRNHPTGSIPKIIYIIYQFIINFILVRILA